MRDGPGRGMARVVLSKRSHSGFPLLTGDSRFETFIREDGSALTHRSMNHDSTKARRAASCATDPITDPRVARRVVDGIVGLDRAPLPQLDDSEDVAH